MKSIMTIKEQIKMVWKCDADVRKERKKRKERKERKKRKRNVMRM